MAEIEVDELPAPNPNPNPNPPPAFNPLHCNAYKCFSVAATFDGAEHHRESHRDYKFKCRECRRIFIAEGSYYEHYDVHIPRVTGRHTKKSTKKPPKPLPNNVEDLNLELEGWNITPIVDCCQLPLRDMLLLLLKIAALNQIWQGTSHIKIYVIDTWKLRVAPGNIWRDSSSRRDLLGLLLSDCPSLFLQIIVAHGKSFGEYKHANIKLLLRSIQRGRDKDDSAELRRSPETPAFAALEFYSDLWAFGVFSYPMVLGEYLFPGDTSLDTSDKGLCQSISIFCRSLMYPSLPDGLNPGLRNLLVGILCKDPKHSSTLNAVAEHCWVVGEQGTTLPTEERM